MTPEGVGISIVTVAGLYQGVFYSTDPASSEEILLEFIQGYEVVQLDDDICKDICLRKRQAKGSRYTYRRPRSSDRFYRAAPRRHSAHQQSQTLRAIVWTEHPLGIKSWAYFTAAQRCLRCPAQQFLTSELLHIKRRRGYFARNLAVEVKCHAFPPHPHSCPVRHMTISQMMGHFTFQPLSLSHKVHRLAAQF